MNYKQLKVWIRSMDLAVEVYEASRTLPPEERYGLALQARRSAASVSSNIAEGEGRFFPRDHLKFLGQARGSLYELETQLILCDRLGYLDASRLTASIEETARLINGTIRTYANRLKG